MVNKRQTQTLLLRISIKEFQYKVIGSGRLTKIYIATKKRKLNDVTQGEYRKNKIKKNKNNFLPITH